MDWAKRFAGRLISETGDSRSAQVDLAYRIAYSRSPDQWEKDTALTFIDKQAKVIAARAAEEGALAQPTVTAANLSPEQGAALVDFCHSILNSNEFVFRY